MIIVLLSFLYIFFSASSWGVVTAKVFKVEKSHAIIKQLLGLFSICMFTSIFAFFSRINIEFHLVLLLLNIIFGVWQKHELFSIFKHYHVAFKSFNKFLKVFFALLSLFILAQAASAPFVIDNESYYLQTIKWLNEYGFVKGLANLHLFFAQNSGWHILQSAFNFSFLHDRLNDISAFLFLMVNFFAFEKINLFLQKKSFHLADIFLAIIPFGSILFFQFISAPSSDIPVFLISFLLFYLLLKHWGNISKEIFTIIYLLSFFTIYIKVSTIFMAFLPLGVLVFHFQQLKRSTPSMIIVGSFTLLLIMLKNQILSGYPLFPIQEINFIDSDYRLPESYKFYFERSFVKDGYDIGYRHFKNLSTVEKFLQWLSIKGLTGVVNKFIAVLMLCFPILILKSNYRKPLAFIYFLAVLQLCVLFFTSPQYRFFLVFVLAFMAIIFFSIFQHKKLLKTLLVFGIIFSGIPLFFSFQLAKFTNNQFTQNNSQFQFKNILVPHKNSKYEYVYQKEKIGNLEYNNPVNQDFFWITGDGELPSIKKEQIEFFYKNFHTIPQLRTGKLKDGFYAKTVENFEDE
ncbi:LIC_10190 family membrane protein [Mesonia mobilis]|uniref:LIC_10190 family membrane protein n=1 Tax=Mesonia mobilis TaxID=369791 RepID=UPI0026EAB3AD|nr:hypothetical protein [Mesonia mobilis]